MSDSFHQFKSGKKRSMYFKKSGFFIPFLLISILFISCRENYTPKPRGYSRLYFPKKEYTRYRHSDCPFEFDIPVYAKVLPDQDRNAQHCWMNIDYPEFKGRIHVSYHDIDSDKKRDALKEDARKLVFKHTVKASAIDETDIVMNDKKVYGTYYEIDGNAASAIQFYLTDNKRHFLRAALYFSVEPKLDSIAPVIGFIKKDIDVMIHSFQWEKGSKS